MAERENKVRKEKTKLRLKPKVKYTFWALLYPLIGFLIMNMTSSFVYRFAEYPSGKTIFSEIASYPEIIIRLFSTFAVIILLMYVCPENSLKVNKKPLNKVLMFFLIFILLVVVFIGQYRRTFSRCFSFMLGLLAVSLFEETLLRMCTLNIWLKIAPDTEKAHMTAVIFSAVQFGFIHTVNLLAGVNPLYVALQIAGGCMVGFFYGIIVHDTGRIIYTVILHSIHNGISTLINPVEKISERQVIYIFVFILILIVLEIKKFIFSFKRTESDSF